MDKSVKRDNLQPSSTRSLANLRCAVLGAGGFIGTNLIAALDGKVKDLRGLIRNNAQRPSATQTQWITGEFEDQDILRELIAGCDTVFHLIGSTTPATGNRNMVADIEGNVVSSIRFFDLCIKEGVERVVFASSGGTVYGIPEVVPTPETAPTRPITSYGISKLSIEMYLELYRYHYGLDYRVLRISNPYGPHQQERKEQGVVSAFLSRAISGEPVKIWGNGTVERDFVYINDVVDALVKSALHAGPSRIFNIGSGSALSLVELISAIGLVLGREIDRLHFEGRPVDVARSELDVRLAGRELRWRPKTSFMDGIAMTAEWMKGSIRNEK